MRVGLFGGTFDPPHNGHLAVAEAAVRVFHLDRLLLAPTGRQPLKSTSPVASFRDRLAMVEVLCEGSSAMESSDIDAPTASGMPNYTIDAIRRLRSRIAKESSIFVVVGADAMHTFQHWLEPASLLAEAEWIVVSRPGLAVQDMKVMELTTEQRSRIHLLSGVHVPVSATELRRKLHDDEECEGLLPEAVLGYIHSHGLYRALP